MDMLSMGDYGFVVWASFLISFLVFLINYVLAHREFTSILNEIKLRHENE